MDKIMNKEVAVEALKQVPQKFEYREFNTEFQKVSSGVKAEISNDIIIKFMDTLYLDFDVSNEVVSFYSVLFNFKPVEDNICETVETIETNLEELVPFVIVNTDVIIEEELQENATEIEQKEELKDVDILEEITNYMENVGVEVVNVEVTPKVEEVVKRKYTKKQ